MLDSFKNLPGQPCYDELVSSVPASWCGMDGVLEQRFLGTQLFVSWASFCLSRFCGGWLVKRMRLFLRAAA